MKVNIPNTYRVAVHGRDVAIDTAKWDEGFILEAVDRAVKEFLRQHSARGEEALGDAITALETAQWRKVAMGPVGKAKRLIAKLSPEQRQTLLEAFNGRHEEKPCQ